MQPIKKGNENGAIAIVFAVAFSTLLIFLAFASDLAFAFSRKAELLEVANLVRDARLALIDESWNAEDPEKVILNMGRDILDENGLDPNKITIRWREGSQVCCELEKKQKCSMALGYGKGISSYQPYDYNKRCARVWIAVHDTYQTQFLRMVGIESIPVSIEIEGYQIDNRQRQRMWKPGSAKKYVY